MTAYRDNLFRLLSDRDPLEVLAQTAFRLAEIVRAHSVTALRTRPFEGKWTPNEIIGHLVDGEWVYGYRLRLIVSEDNPAILGTRISGSPASFTMSESRRSSWTCFERCASSIWRCGNDCPRRIGIVLASTTSAAPSPWA